MKGAFLMIARNKAKWVRRSAQAMLAQTHSPLEIIFSDHGSDDGTREIIEECVRGYNGPNKVRIIDCPLKDHNGLVGCNVHLDWAHTQPDADWIMLTSADDIAHPERAAKTAPIYEEHKPDMVLTSQEYMEADGKVRGRSLGPDETRWCVPKDCTELLVGGSSSQSYSHEFVDAIGPLGTQTCGQDVVMPMLATLRNGAYYLHEVLHYYYEIADENNAGLGGVIRATSDPVRKLQLEEVMHFQGAANWAFIVAAMERWAFSISSPTLSNLAYGVSLE